KPFPHHRLIIHHQASDAHSATPSNGNETATRKPPASVGSAARDPPSRATRSRIPVRPRPGRWPLRTVSPLAPLAPAPGPFTTSSSSASDERLRTTETALPL